MGGAEWKEGGGVEPPSVWTGNEVLQPLTRVRSAAASEYACLPLGTGSFRGGFDGQMVLVVVAVGAGARERGPAAQRRERGGGVYYPRCQRAAM